VCDTEVSEFSFASGYAKLQLDINKLQFNGDAEVEIYSDFVSKVCTITCTVSCILIQLKCNVELTHVRSL